MKFSIFSTHSPHLPFIISGNEKTSLVLLVLNLYQILKVIRTPLTTLPTDTFYGRVTWQNRLYFSWHHGRSCQSVLHYFYVSKHVIGLHVTISCLTLRLLVGRMLMTLLLVSFWLSVILLSTCHGMQHIAWRVFLFLFLRVIVLYVGFTLALKRRYPYSDFVSKPNYVIARFFFYRTSPIPYPSDLISSNPHKREIDQSQISQIRTPSEFRPIPCTCLDSGDGLGGAAEEVVRLACSGVEGTRQKFGNWTLT